MKIFALLLILVLAVSCGKKYSGPDTYQDGFETYANYDALFLPDDAAWSFSQITNDANTAELDTTLAASGSRSLLFTAEPTTDDVVSKCSISKQRMCFREGRTVRISADYYIFGNDVLNWLFLLDLEEQANIGAGPGMRLALVDNKLRVEYKFNQDDILQTGDGVAFPRDQWVHLDWEVTLSRKKKGSVKLWQNGELILSKDGQVTLPRDFLYFQQGTKGMYTSVEFGITANSDGGPAKIAVDNVKIATL
jgi:hypothetical protein